jgi:hypothetical protein
MELVLCFSFLLEGNDIEEVISIHICTSSLIDLNCLDKEFVIFEGVFTKMFEVILQKVNCKHSSKNGTFHKIKISLRYNIYFIHFLL